MHACTSQTEDKLSYFVCFIQAFHFFFIFGQKVTWELNRIGEVPPPASNSKRPTHDGLVQQQYEGVHTKPTMYHSTQNATFHACTAVGQLSRLEKSVNKKANSAPNNPPWRTQKTTQCIQSNASAPDNFESLPPSPLPYPKKRMSPYHTNTIKKNVFSQQNKNTHTRFSRTACFTPRDFRRTLGRREYTSEKIQSDLLL